ALEEGLRGRLCCGARARIDIRCNWSRLDIHPKWARLEALSQAGTCDTLCDLVVVLELVGCRHATGRLALPPPVDAPAELANGRLALRGEKRPSAEGGEPPRKKIKLTVLKRPASTIRGTSKRGHRYKGKESAKTAKLPSHAFTLRDLCEVGDRVGKDRYFAAHISKLLPAEAEEQQKVWWLNFTSSTQVWTNELVAAEYVRGALHPTLAKQLYEYSSEELMDQAAKSTVWVRDF
ncbi:hypothetical protein BHM03_00034133, partial [Ensete ventricosum]